MDTMRHKNITDPEHFYPNYFAITVTRFEISPIIFGKLPNTYQARKTSANPNF